MQNLARERAQMSQGDATWQSECNERRVAGSPSLEDLSKKYKNEGYARTFD